VIPISDEHHVAALLWGMKMKKQNGLAFCVAITIRGPRRILLARFGVCLRTQKFRSRQPSLELKGRLH
jgi:hypothetical protein